LGIGRIAEFAHAWIKGTLRIATVSLPRKVESDDGSHLGLPELQPDALVRPATLTASRVRNHRLREEVRRNVDEQRKEQESALAAWKSQPSHAAAKTQFLHTFQTGRSGPRRGLPVPLSLSNTKLRSFFTNRVKNI